VIPTFLQGRRGVIIALVVTSLVLITLDQRGSAVLDGARRVSVDVLAPVRSVMSALFAPVKGAWNGIFDYDDLREENDRLRRQIDQQEGDSIESEAQIRGYEELRAFRDLPVRSDIPVVMAEVVGDSSSNFVQTIEINKGANDGIRTGMAVITPAGLVGRIGQVSTNRAVVRLLTDPGFTASVKVAPRPRTVTLPPTTAPPAARTPATTAARAAAPTTAPPATPVPPPGTRPPATTIVGDVERGLLEGTGFGRLPTIDLVNLEANVNEGDPVVTSGIRESLFPADIPVGRVAEVKRTPGSLHLDVRVEPSAVLGDLTYVAVLRYLPAD
jgi:rod shape-determining protein MreC